MSSFRERRPWHSNAELGFASPSDTLLVSPSRKAILKRKLGILRTLWVTRLTKLAQMEGDGGDDELLMFAPGL